MWKHWANFHNTEETQDYSIKKEALQIDKHRSDSLMNSKKEYGANSVIRQKVLFKDQAVEEGEN